MPQPMDAVTLAGRHVRLEPLDASHADALAAAAAIDRSSYDYTWVPDGRAGMTAYIETLLADHRRGAVLPFAQRDLASGELVGCTRFMEPHWWRHRVHPDEVEIGGTWLAAPAQRTAINTEAKLLMLGHAFDTLGVWRVAICTDARNERSRRAIERIGATFEGVLRNHRTAFDTETPTPRQSAMFSIVAEEWDGVRARLLARLGAGP